MDEKKFATWIEEHSVGSTLSRKSSAPTKTQLASLLSVKSFPPVLDFMIKHVRPTQERRHIRHNLKNFHFRKHLVEEKNVTEIQKRHSKLKSMVEDAEKELLSETEDLKRIVEEEHYLGLEEKKLRSQIALFDIACRERENVVKKLKKQNEVVEQLLPETPKFVSPQDESIKLNVAVEDMDFILEKLKILRIDVLDNNEDLHDQKIEAWNLVETLLANHSPAVLMRGFSSIISRETNSISQATNTVDLIGDAEALNLRYSNGVFTDVLNPHGIVESVESMVLQMSAKHIKRHLALQKLKQETKLTKDSLVTISDSIQTLVKEQHNDPLIVSGLMDLFRATNRVSGLKASIAAASSLINDLEAKAEVARKGKESVEEKYNRITCFEETVETKNDDLKELVVAISKSLKEVEEEKVKVASLVKESVDSIVLPTPFLKGSFSQECEAVTNVPFEALATVQTENGRVPSSSVGPVDDLHSDLSKLSRMVPYVTSWENVLETVRRQKANLNEKKAQLAEESSHLEMITKKSTNQHLSNFVVKGWQEKVRTHDQRLEEDLLPVIQKCEETHEKAEKIVARFKESLEEWWTQPGPEIKQYLKK